MTVENGIIIISAATAISYLILYKKSNLFGSISMMVTGILTYYYSRTGEVDATAYGVLGSIIFGTALILLTIYLFEPIKKRR